MQYMKSRLTNVEVRREEKRREEDVTFVEDQIKARKGKFWTADSIYDSKINAKKVREEKYNPKTPKSRKRFIDRPAEVTPSRTRKRKNTVLSTCETDENLNELTPKRSKIDLSDSPYTPSHPI